MGGVRRIDDPGGDIYGTNGYSAPEAGDGPTVASDLYTVGRTLAVLLMDFRFQSAIEFTLPPPAEQPVLAQHESLYRFLLRATAEDPDATLPVRRRDGRPTRRRAARDRRPAPEGSGERPVESNLFGGDLMALQEHEDEGVASPSPAMVPELKADPSDPGARFLLGMANVAVPRRRAVLLQEALLRFPESFELPLRLARPAWPGRFRRGGSPPGGRYGPRSAGLARRMVSWAEPVAARQARRSPGPL